MPVTRISCSTDISVNSGASAWIGAKWLELMGPRSSIADDVHDATEGLGADGDLDRVAGVDALLATDEALGTVHGDSTNGGFSKMLGHLEDEAGLAVPDLERVEDGREGAIFELDVDDGTDDGDDLAGVGACCGGRAGLGGVLALAVGEGRAEGLRCSVGGGNDGEAGGLGQTGRGRTT
jgi:hypothetical protein